MNLNKLVPTKGSTKNSDTVLNVAGKKGSVSPSRNYDVKYLGKAQFRFSEDFLEKNGFRNNLGLNPLSESGATIATIKEFAFQVVNKDEKPRYFGKSRVGTNPKTGEKVTDTKNSPVISSSVFEAYLINTNQATKDVKSAYNLTLIEQDGTVFVTVANNSVSEAPTTNNVDTEIISEVEEIMEGVDVDNDSEEI